MIFHHIGVATGDLAATAEVYMGMGFSMTAPVDDPAQSVIVAFLSKEGHPLIELVTPLGDKSPVDNVVKKMRVSPYHTCYEVDDLELAITELREKRFMIVADPVAAAAFDGRRICFMFSRATGLWELVEKEKRK